MAGDQPADPADTTGGKHVRAVRQPRDGPRVLLRGGRGRARTSTTWRSATSWSRCRSRSTPRACTRSGSRTRIPGGYAELMVLNELLAIKVPTGLPHRMAAMTEPLAVGVHAVAKSKIAVGEAAVVIGLGPGRPGLHRGDEDARHRPDHRVRLLTGAPRARRASRLRRGRRSGRRGADRRVAPGRRQQAARDLRGRRCARE